MLPASAWAKSALPQYYNNEYYFTIRTYQNLQNNLPSNFVACPLLIETFMKLVQLACDDETAEEIRRALFQIDLPNDKIQSDVIAMYKLLGEEVKKLDIITSIYLDEQFYIQPEFLETMDVFQAKLYRHNFSQPEETASSINKEITISSRQSVTELVKSEELHNEIRSILGSTIFFENDWYRPFYNYKVQRKFHKNRNEEIEVDVVQSISAHQYFRSDELKANLVELRFGDHGALVLVVPDEIDGLGFLEENIRRLFKIRSFHFEERYVKIEFPAFKIITKLDYTNILKECGILRIFKQDQANLIKFIDNVENYFINHVFQKVCIDVAEQGMSTVDVEEVEKISSNFKCFSASVTAISILVDRPFMFYIRIYDAIIFVGRVVDPTIRGEVP